MAVDINMTHAEYVAMSRQRRTHLNKLRRSHGLPPYHAATGKPSPMRGRSNSSKGKPRPHLHGIPKPTLRGPKPHRWIVGPDQERHAKHQPWHKARAQAHFRGEIWDLSFDQWEQIWGDKWNQRGRASHEYCMVMIDRDHGWVPGNVEVITRKEHLARSGFARRGTLRRAM